MPEALQNSNQSISPLFDLIKYAQVENGGVQDPKDLNELCRVQHRGTNSLALPPTELSQPLGLAQVHILSCGRPKT